MNNNIEFFNPRVSQSKQTALDGNEKYKYNVLINQNNEKFRIPRDIKRNVINVSNRFKVL